MKVQKVTEGQAGNCDRGMMRSNKGASILHREMSQRGIMLPILILMNILPAPEIKNGRKSLPHLLPPCLMLQFHLRQTLLTHLHRAPLGINLERMRRLPELLHLMPVCYLWGPHLARINAVWGARGLEAE